MREFETIHQLKYHAKPSARVITAWGTQVFIFIYLFIFLFVMGIILTLEKYIPVF